jgi:hypothetical protein
LARSSHFVSNYPLRGRSSRIVASQMHIVAFVRDFFGFFFFTFF